MAHYKDRKEKQCLLCRKTYYIGKDDNFCNKCIDDFKRFSDDYNHISTAYVVKTALVVLPKRYYNKRDSKGRFSKRKSE